MTLRQVIEYLEQLPVDSPEWLEVPQFLARVQSIWHERAAREVEQARVALNRLVGDHADLLRYFEVESTELSESKVRAGTEIRQPIQELESRFVEYRSLLQRAGPETFSASVAYRRVLFDAEQKIISLLGKLVEQLGAARLDGESAAPGERASSGALSHAHSGPLDGEVQATPLATGAVAANAHPLRDVPVTSEQATAPSRELADVGGDRENPAAAHMGVPADISGPPGDPEGATPDRAASQDSTDSEAVRNVSSPTSSASAGSNGPSGRSSSSDRAKKPAAESEKLRERRLRLQLDVALTSPWMSSAMVADRTLASTAASDEESRNTSPTDSPINPSVVEQAVDGESESAQESDTAPTPASIHESTPRRDPTESVSSGTMSVQAADVDVKNQTRSCVEERPTASESHASATGELDDVPSEETSRRESTPRLADFLQEALRSGDMAGAYWAVKSQEAAGEDVPFPHWLPAAVLAARQPADNMEVADDLQRLASETPPLGNTTASLLAVAASLLPTLSHPLVNLNSWLAVELPSGRLREIVAAVRRFAEHGQKIDFQEFGKQSTREAAERQVEGIVADACRWLDNAPERTVSFQRATQAWRLMTRANGPLHTFLSSVRHDRREDLSRVEQQTNRWSERTYIIRCIQDLDYEIRRSRVNPIEGSALVQVVSWAYEACEIARRWVLGVRRLQRLGATPTWSQQQIATLRETLATSLPAAIMELSATTEVGGGLDEAALHAVVASLRQLAASFQIELGEEPGAERTSSRPSRAEQCHLAGLLARRLWSLAELDLNDDGEPRDERSLVGVFPALWRAWHDRRSVAQVVESWLERRDHRFLDGLLDAVADADEYESLRGKVAEQREAMTGLVESRRAAEETRVQNGVIDGVFNDIQRSESLRQLAEVGRSCVLDFASALRTCDRVRDSVEAAYADCCSAQRSDWEQNRERLLRELPEDVRSRVEALIETAFTRRDVRLIHEYVAQVNLAQGESRLTILDASAARPDVLEMFIASQTRLVASSDRWRQRSAGGAAGDGDLSPEASKLSVVQRQEALRALDAWETLRRKPPEDSDLVLRRALPPLMAFLGLESNGRAQEFEMVAARRQSWAHVRIQADDRRLSLVPQFGSRREGHYDLLCVWGELSPLSLARFLAEAKLERDAVLVVHFNRLTVNQRLNLGRTAQTGNLEVLLFDELMLHFLVEREEERWPLFQRIALPFGVVNPYLPRCAGNVPREMFFGRREMLHSILDFSGSGTCLVYGGRQLGKSTLLERAKREFHDPERRQYAILLEITHVGDPLTDTPAERLWSLLREELNRVFFDKPISAEQPEAVCKHIRSRLEDDSRAKLLILLDEVDMFLDQDGEQSFRNVTQLKILMERTDRRVKVVFAGLHNVQRFQGIPNQPFAHLGAPLEVGPLEPPAAKDLVQIPIETIGYRFQDESLVLKILSYTNFHPGLIQLFCWRLVEELRQTPRTTCPPFEILPAAVRGVYSRTETQREIRERFQWTLQLDARYNAITWMILSDELVQASAGGVYAAQDLHVRLRESWPAAFGTMPRDQFGGLLDELCGLGVLLRVGSGYRLRSPNLRHLVGDVEEIWSNLHELKDRPAPNVGFKADRHRMLMGRTGRRSPLTYAQSRLLIRPKFGVGLVVGSPALGLDDLPQALQRLLPDSNVGNLVYVESWKWDSADAWEERLRSFLECHGDRERLIYGVDIGAPPRDLAAVVRKAQKFCEARAKTEKRWMRIILGFAPPTMWAWGRLPDDERSDLESAVDTIARLDKWDGEAILLHLRQCEKLELASVVDHLLAATDGWPRILDEVFQRCGRDMHDPRPAADEVLRELNVDGSLRSEFRAAIGLDATPQADVVCRILRELREPFEQEFMTMLLEEAGVSAPLCPALVDFLGQIRVLESVGSQWRVNRRVAQVIASS